MGFLQPDMPRVAPGLWAALPRSERIRTMVRHLAERGSPVPTVVHLAYVVKIGLYILGGYLLVLSTSGIDGFTNVASWWSEPIVFQKVVLYTMLFEVVGLGCGFGPLTGRYAPPMGSVLYWLRAGTVRLPPWPERIPATRGTRRTPVDAALYGALLVVLTLAVFGDGTRQAGLHTQVGVLADWYTWTVLGLLAVLGLRDKTIFLAARGEVYGPLALVFLFSGDNVLLGAKLCFMVIWMGAAVSKLNRHFPFVITGMMINNPLLPKGAMKRMYFRRVPDDIRPGPVAIAVAHAGTAVELAVPWVLFLSGGGWVTTVAGIVMICFHSAILSAIPAGVPLEWNVFMIFGVLWLFLGHRGITLADASSPWPFLLVAVMVTVVTVGNLAPRKVSFLPSMRYYAGNWDTSLWCVKPSAVDKIHARISILGKMQHVQLASIYGEAEAQVPIHLGYGFRALNTHGRALFTLVHRALSDADEQDYVVCEGELVAALVLGWNFGDGHLHNENLIGAMQERCEFVPGEVRVVILDGQPIQRQDQQYRLVDAASGELERGRVRVKDLVDAQPWFDDIPVQVEHRAQPAPAPGS